MARIKYQSAPKSPRQSTIKWAYILPMVMALLIASYAWWFFYTFEKVDTGTVYYPQREVAQNRYFAAQTLLGERATTLQHQEGQDELEHIFADTQNAKDKAVMLYQLADSKQGNIEQMLEWVQAGGQLIVFNQAMLGADEKIGSDYRTQQNPLLLHLGIHYREYDYYTFSGKDNSFRDLDTYVTPVRLSDGETAMVYGSRLGRFDVTEFLQAYPESRLYDYNWFVKNEQFYQLASPTITHLTQTQTEQLTKIANDYPDFFDASKFLVDIAFGQGRLTVVSSPNVFINPYAVPFATKDGLDDKKDVADSRSWLILTNDTEKPKHNYRNNLARADNAYFLLYLTQGRHVYFAPDIEATGFMTLIRQHLSYSWIGLWCLLIVSLLALPKRFGRLKTYETDVGRNIFGFFGHVGMYLWADDGAKTLLDANRHALIQTILARESVTEQTPNAISQAVSDKTGLSLSMVHEALYGRWDDERRFIQISRSFARVAKFYS